MIPTISISHKDLLDKPITTSEVDKARQSMQSSKAPGPDGYTSELYKAFKTQVSPLILDVLNEALIKALSSTSQQTSSADHLPEAQAKLST